MKYLKLIAACTALVTGATVSAAQEDQVLSGAGAQGCGGWLQASAKVARTGGGHDFIYVSWVQGYLSGLNMPRILSKKDELKMPDMDTIRAYLDKHCRDKPLDKVSEAAFMLFIQLEKAK